jgi:hypothetical protein
MAIYTIAMLSYPRVIPMMLKSICQWSNYAGPRLPALSWVSLPPMAACAVPGALSGALGRGEKLGYETPKGGIFDVNIQLYLISYMDIHLHTWLVV